jgi:outer membrane protein TolC
MSADHHPTLIVPRVLAALTVAVVSGCAKLSPDGQMSIVSAQVSRELDKKAVKISTEAEAALAKAKVTALLARPLTADSSVQIALLGNRGLQAEYNALGISEADFVEASLPPVPTFSIERIAGGGELEIERRLVASILSLFTLRERRSIAEKQIQAAQYRAIEATFRLAADVRRAYYRAVAARQITAFLDRARLSAEAAAELTRRLGETGAATKLAQARASAFYAETSNQLARARLQQEREREQLTRLLGLWGSDSGYELPRQLPDLPSKLRTSQQVEVDAVRKRVDLIAARLELDATARSLGLTERTRMVSVLELAGISSATRASEDGETERSHMAGLELEVQVPIWDFGKTRVRRARETYMQAVNRLIEKAVNARSQAREAYIAYRGTYDISRQYRNQILPLRSIISEQALLEYNGMLIDVFDLLTTSRESINSNIAAIEAKRDFFLASVDFQAAIIGGLGSGGAAENAGTAVSETPAAGH